MLLDQEINTSQKYSGGARQRLPWLSPVNALIFIYLLVYKLVFLDAVSGTLYIILQKIKLNWAQCPENASIPFKEIAQGL